MDAPAVRYTTTSDGFDIAFVAEGEGPPLVYLPFHFNHAQRRWTGPLYARGMAGLRRVYLYDSRGQGLSTRGLHATPTLEDYACDLEAVIEANHLDRFALAAYGGFAHVAVRYAIEHPERVEALILICTSASFTAWPLLSMLPLMEENWDLFLELTYPKNAPEDFKERWLSFQNASVTRDDHIHMVKAFAESDVSALLPRLAVPVLLLHSERQHWLSVDEGAKLAASIPNARLVFLSGDAEPDDAQCARASLAFLEELGPLIQEGAAPSIAAPSASLSPRQREVLKLLAQGMTTREIAARLILSERTVQRHIADLYSRIGARNRAEATAYELSRAVAGGSAPLGASTQ
jgi:pimeloyl-ACP methyl ester carboxylesterase/DNA-binding CsgD family transcriptional regulator